MDAYFRFYAALNEFLPAKWRQMTFAYPAYDGSQSVKHLIESIGPPHTEVELILVNGEVVSFDYPVQPGNRISVYPFFTSLNGTPLGQLRPFTPNPAKFLLDNHLGRLARYLRLFGFDTLYFHNQFDDAGLAQIAFEQNRILLSRDRGLLKRSRVIHGCCLRTRDSKEQLTAVFHRYQLYDQIRPWRRCLRCNGLLHPVDKTDILHRLEPKTKLYFHSFQMCGDCRQIYWQGSHTTKLEALIRQIITNKVVS